MNTGLRRAALRILLVALGLIFPPAVLAQDADYPPDAPFVGGAAPLLSPQHWAVAAARRAEALGLAPGYLPADRAVSRDRVGAALHSAALRAPRMAPGLAALANSWWERYAEEFVRPVAPIAPRSPVRLLGSAALLGFTGRADAAAPGLGEFEPTRTGSLPLSDRAGIVAGASIALGFGPHATVLAEPVAAAGDWESSRWEVRAALGGVAVSVGRQPVGYGYGTGGGVTLSGAVPLDRVAIENARPVRLPGWLGVLGPFALQGFLSRMSDDRHPGDPFFWGAGGVLQPHPRVTLSLQRAALFGGAGATLPVTAGNIGRMLIGRVSGGSFEDQIVSGGVRYRLPSEAIVPLTAYIEWGSEDAAGAVSDVPGVVAGLWSPALPGIPQVALGAEYASFAESCCGNPPWYRHGAFPGSWAAEERPLGHPLGGNGSEILVYSEVDLAAARLRLDARAFRRRRDAENLYVPGRERSSGAALGGTWRVRPNADLTWSLATEIGAGWSQADLQAGARVFF